MLIFPCQFLSYPVMVYLRTFCCWQLLAKSDQMRKEADDTGPHAELDHWRQLQARFSSLLEEVKSHKCRMTLTILNVAKSKLLKVSQNFWSCSVNVYAYEICVCVCEWAVKTESKSDTSSCMVQWHYRLGTKCKTMGAPVIVYVTFLITTTSDETFMINMWGVEIDMLSAEPLLCIRMDCSTRKCACESIMHHLCAINTVTCSYIRLLSRWYEGGIFLILWPLFSVLWFQCSIYF